jgi:hypothetical protein
LYLAEARGQYDRSDFKAAGAFAQKALAQAQEAYDMAVEKHAPPLETPVEIVKVDTGSLVTRPKSSLDEAIREAQTHAARLEEQGAKRCAPKEFAYAEAGLAFSRAEWAQRNYNKAANHLRAAVGFLEQASRFTADCPPDPAPAQSPPKPGSDRPADQTAH